MSVEAPFANFNALLSALPFASTRELLIAATLSSEFRRAVNSRPWLWRVVAETSLPADTLPDPAPENRFAVGVYRALAVHWWWVADLLAGHPYFNALGLRERAGVAQLLVRVRSAGDEAAAAERDLARLGSVALRLQAAQERLEELQHMLAELDRMHSRGGGASASNAYNRLCARVMALVRCPACRQPLTPDSRKPVRVSTGCAHVVCPDCAAGLMACPAVPVGSRSRQPCGQMVVQSAVRPCGVFRSLVSALQLHEVRWDAADLDLRALGAARAQLQRQYGQWEGKVLGQMAEPRARQQAAGLLGAGARQELDNHVQAAFRKRALALHPDRNPGADTAAEMDEARKARDALVGEERDAYCSQPHEAYVASVLRREQAAMEEEQVRSRLHRQRRAQRFARGSAAGADERRQLMIEGDVPPQPPAPEARLCAPGAQGTVVELKWDRAAGYSGYRLFQVLPDVDPQPTDGGAAASLLYEGHQHSFSTPPLRRGTYTFALDGCNSARIHSPASVPREVDVPGSREEVAAAEAERRREEARAARAAAERRARERERQRRRRERLQAETRARIEALVADPDTARYGLLCWLREAAQGFAFGGTLNEAVLAARHPELLAELRQADPAQLEREHRRFAHQRRAARAAATRAEQKGAEGEEDEGEDEDEEEVLIQPRSRDDWLAVWRGLALNERAAAVLAPITELAFRLEQRVCADHQPAVIEAYREWGAEDEDELGLCPGAPDVEPARELLEADADLVDLLLATGSLPEDDQSEDDESGGEESGGDESAGEDDDGDDGRVEPPVPPPLLRRESSCESVAESEVGCDVCDYDMDPRRIVQRAVLELFAEGVHLEARAGDAALREL